MPVPLTTAPRARTMLMPGNTVAVQLVPGGPVEAVTCLALPGHRIYLDCTCGCHGAFAACPHAAAAGDRLVREGLAAPDADGWVSTAGLATEPGLL